MPPKLLPVLLVTSIHPQHLPSSCQAPSRVLGTLPQSGGTHTVLAVPGAVAEDDRREQGAGVEAALPTVKGREGRSQTR